MSDSDLTRAAKAIGRRLPAPVTRILRFAWHRRGAFLARRALGTVEPEILAWAETGRRPVSIVIPSYNDIPLLTKCLDSIERTCAGYDYEVLVVDDFCQPTNSAALRKLEGERVRVIFKEQRMGFAVSVNRGMAEAAHDIVLVNSDIVALPGWLEGLQYSAYAGDPKVGLVSGRLIYPDGRVQYGGTIWSRTWAPQWFSHRYAGHLASYTPARVPDYNWGASGACLYITREAYEQLGGLDEQYWLGFEDVDYAMRAWEAGIRSYYEPRATLIHHESATRGRHQGNRELGSMRLFWTKWGHLHDAKTGGEPTTSVDLIVGEDTDPLWTRYVEETAVALAARGWTVETHRVKGDAEALIETLSPRASLKVATSPATRTIAWLAATTRGIPVNLLPGIQESPAAIDIASLKPEFDHIVPNGWSGSILERRTSWPAAAVVAPAIAPGKDAQRPTTGVAVLTMDAAADADAIDALRTQWRDCTVIETVWIDDETERQISELAPRALVCLTEFGRSLEPLRLMSLGAAFVGSVNDRTAFEVLDGLNGLLIPRGDHAMLIERVAGILEDEATYETLRQNGRGAAQACATASADRLSLALHDIALRRG